MKLYFALFLGLFVRIAQGQVIVVDAVEPTQQICSQIGVLKLPESPDLNHPEKLGPFEYFNTQAHNLGLSKDTYLLKMILTSNAAENMQYTMELLQPGMDKCTFIRRSGNQWLFTQISDNTIIADRAIKNQNPSIEINLSKSRLDTVYLAVTSGEQILTPIRIGPKETIENISHTKDILYGVFCGIMLALILYNFFIYIRIF
jgi:hypothetical protein